MRGALRLAWLTRRRVGLAVSTLVLGLLPLASCVADAPPAIGPAIAGDGRATVSWAPPVAIPSTITSYVITPFIGSVAQPPVVTTSTATTHIVNGLATGTTYTFTVHGINA